MKHLACLLLGLAATAAADTDSPAAATAPAPAPTATMAPAATAPALSDDETLAQQLVYCAVVAQKLGGTAQKGWAVSYGSAAVAMSSTAFVAAQTLAQTGAADSLAPADLDNASAQCQQTMLTNTTRIAAAMQHRQGGGAGQ